MSKYREDLFIQIESLDIDEYILAKYIISTETDDYLRLSGAIAIEQSTGSWIKMAMETPEMIARHGAKVVSVFEVPDYEYEIPDGKRTFVMEIAFPIVNFGPQLPMMLTSIMGVISMMGDIKLVDITFPESYAKDFPGPKFGITGIREQLGVADRPLVASVIKPPAGLTPEQTGKFFYEAASGGADIIKDDEKVANASYSSVVERVKECMAAEKKVYEVTGKHTLYAVNITDLPSAILDNAKAAIDAGGNMLMICHLTVGLGTVQDLVGSAGFDLPILAHPDFAGAISWSQHTGISSHLSIGKLPRICGVDVSAYPMCYGRMPITKEKYLKIALSLRAPLYDLKPAWPQVGGALHPGMVKLVMDDLGSDFILGAGGSVSAHPLGPRGGVRALLQAVEAIREGRDLLDAAKEHKELKVAIDAWGIVDEDRRAVHALK
jgi:2,3-diketo-5-methylthiopentyl-1-phosphate enolase